MAVPSYRALQSGNLFMLSQEQHSPWQCSAAQYPSLADPSAADPNSGSRGLSIRNASDGRTVEEPLGAGSAGYLEHPPVSPDRTNRNQVPAQF